MGCFHKFTSIDAVVDLDGLSTYIFHLFVIYIITIDYSYFGDILFKIMLQSQKFQNVFFVL